MVLKEKLSGNKLSNMQKCSLIFVSLYYSLDPDAPVFPRFKSPYTDRLVHFVICPSHQVGVVQSMSIPFFLSPNIHACMFDDSV